MGQLLRAVLTVLLAWQATGETSLPPALAAIVEAELAFARLTAEKGIRAGFYEFFAEDGINFTPHPTKLREAYRKNPAPPPSGPPRFTLDWKPTYGDVSAAGDLGYLTGPFTLTDNSPEKNPPKYGQYFSVWKKQPDGAWRVLVDIGVDTPAPEAAPTAFQRAPQDDTWHDAPKGAASAARDALFAREKSFFDAAASQGVEAAYQAFLGAHARLHRNGIPPILGREPIRAYFAPKKLMTTGQAIDGTLAASEDLGFTYGSYTTKDPAAGSEEKGYYTRVWQRDAKGEWRIVADIASPIPPENR